MSEQTGNAAVADQATQATPDTTTTDTMPSGDWYAQIPAEYGTEKSLASFKGKPLGEFVRSYVEAQKMIGGSIRLPGEKDKPEEAAKKREDIYNKLGRPESADKYDIKMPEMPEGLGFSEQHDKDFRATAHKLGLSTTQLQGLYEWYGNYLGSFAPAMAARRQDAQGKLQEEWGANFKQNHSLAIRALADLSVKALGQDGASAFMDELERTGMGNHVGLIKLFSKLGAQMKEDGLITGDGDFTTDHLQQRLTELTKPGSPWRIANHPDHDKAVQEVQALREQLENPLLSRA